MKKFITLFSMSLLFLISSPGNASLNVFACEPEWASLAKELGGDHLNINTATNAFQDPHHIEARPSLIAKVRRADLIICSGADLEIGWLPMLLRQAGNSKVLPGKTGYFETALEVTRLDIPTEISRNLGDIHAAGNPHVHLDPRRLQVIAESLLMRLIEINPENKSDYQKRYHHFKQRWQQAISKWQDKAKVLNSARIVIHHRDWVYLFDWLGIEIAGALEPRPGLPTTAAHLFSLKKTLIENPALMIIHAPHQSPRAAKRLSAMLDLPVIELPYTVGSTPQTQNLFDLFDAILETLIQEKLKKNIDGPA